MHQIPFLVAVAGFFRSRFSTRPSRIGKRGMEMGMLIKLVIWIAVIVLVTAIIIKYIAGTGSNPLPGEELLG